ncbi:hypothetical protein L6R29_11175 [Myxococcota bacterium]|nr:hypothetical protein [Myxococcota bacterium]
MTFPFSGKPRVTRISLAVFVFGFLLLHQTACLPPPLSLDCDFCFDGTCGVNTGFVCKDGYCVPESDPNPARCKTELPDGGLEKTEPLDETSPEEATNPEEAANPEEPTSPEPEPYIETEPERPETPDTQHVLITLLEGDDDREQPLSYPTGTSAPPNAKEAKFRFRTSWRVFGANLRRIDSWKLQSKDKSQTFTLNATDIKDTDMKLTLPAALTAGFFTLLGLIGTTPTVQAEVYVLQGKDGKDGKDGAQGPKGDTGTQGPAGKDGLGFDPTTVTFVNALKSAVSIQGSTLTFKADTITVDTKTFTVKGDTKQTTLTLDDSAQTITLKNANLHIQSGSGSTDGTVNGFGNLILGYNEDGGTAKTRTGSHNLILGREHSYTEHSSILSGTKHTVNAPYASAIGGSSNTITSNAPHAVAIAGANNTFASSRTALYAASLGGEDNQINSNYAAAVAGQNNSNTGTHAAAVAGQNNSITATHAATLAGGGTDANNDKNTVSQSHAAAVAGQKNTVNGKNAAAVAGQNNTVDGTHAAAVAGQNNSIIGTHAATLAGGGTDANNHKNTVSQSHSAILGGQKNNINVSSKAAVAVCGSFGVNSTLSTSSCCVGTPP